MKPAATRPAPRRPAREEAAPRTPRDTWAELGARLGAALAAADRALAQRFAEAVELRLAYFPKADARLRAAVARALAGACDTGAIVSSFGFVRESADLSALRALVGLWEHLTEEAGDDLAAAWDALDAHLAEQACADLAEGAALAAQARHLAADLDRQRAAPVTLWPLVPAGDLRDRVRAWRDAFAARAGVDAATLIDPADVPTQMTYEWHPAPLAASNLAVWLEERAAWSRALANVLAVRDIMAEEG